MGTKTEDHFNFKVLVTQPYESFLFSVNEYVYLGIHFRCWDLARVSNLADQQLLLCGHVQETEGPISSESVSFLSSDTETRGQKKKYKCLDEKHHLTMKPEKTQALPGNARVQDILSVFFLTLSPTPPMMSLRAFSLQMCPQPGPEHRHYLGACQKCWVHTISGCTQTEFAFSPR